MLQSTGLTCSETQQEEAAPMEESGRPPTLTVRCGGQLATVGPERGEVTLGRDPSSVLRMDHSWLSRTHVRLRPEGANWIAIDNSRNGIFVDGARVEQLSIRDGMTLRLGDAEGVAVDFFLGDVDESDLREADEGLTSEEAIDPAIARAGSAVAARRRELELTQRGLARDKIINAGALIAFEKGRSWPHESTRAKLEQVLQWPAGSIANLRDGGTSPDEESTQVISTAVASPLIAQTIQLALKSIETATEALPAQDSAEYNTRVGAILTDLRNLQTVAADAAKNAPGTPALVLALGAVRRRHDELIERAAAAPEAPLGRRLYAARRRASLTADDAALAAGLPTGAITAAEAEQPIPEPTRAALEALIEQL
ncbi:FHA domain-containing protein [Mycolicibacterium brumae]|nr:FHA domain-containing protein [Mycolicibacterium brumae]MCV7192882.1 FHA domain-containing protein [Mycolicibacterium brumae]UWW08599.1 FHA domain-containing protein [Mycolicibacterium brumae]